MAAEGNRWAGEGKIPGRGWRIGARGGYSDSMRPHARARRLLTVVWAIFQIAAPLAAAQADAREAVRAGDVRAHVEDVSGARCAPVHAGDCVVCKQLSFSSLAECAPSYDLPMGRASSVRPTPSREHRGDPRTATLPRAPPTTTR